MTIHADWISQFKDWAPHAFNAKSDPTFEPGQEVVGFIDGQIKLMGMPRVMPTASPPTAPETPLPAFEPLAAPTTTWSTFLQAQFAHPIRRLWRMGARRVVLAFDDYENVPKGKAITQASRRARHMLGPQFVFHADDPLPPFPPTGEDWTKAMSNRAFKARVQQLIVESLPELLSPPPLARPAPAFVVVGHQESGLRLIEQTEPHHDGRRDYEQDDPAPQPDVAPDAPCGQDRAHGSGGVQAGGAAEEGAPPPEVPAVPPGEEDVVVVVDTRPPFQVIVDWRGPSLVEFTWNGADGAYEGAETHRPRAPIGEADIKFAHWTRAVNEIRRDHDGRPPLGGASSAASSSSSPSLLLLTTPPTSGQEGAPPPPPPPATAMAVLATDGDFIPIALLLPEQIPIYILRIEKRVDGAHPPPLPDHSHSGGSGRKSVGGGMEWVDIRGLRAELLKRNVITLMGTPAADPHLPGISPLLVLIALTGTDYSRNLPSIGPKTILKKHGLTSALRLARSALVLAPAAAEATAAAESAAPHDRPLPHRLHLLDVDAAAHSLVASLYASMYHQHTLSNGGGGQHRGPSPRFTSLLELLCRNTRIAEKTRARLPSLAQVRTTLRNANFLLQYWRGLLIGVPDSASIDPRHGFRENPATGAVEWDDHEEGHH